MLQKIKAVSFLLSHLGLVFCLNANALTFHEIASGFDIIENARPALSDDGKVAFSGKIDRTHPAIFVGEGGPLTQFNLALHNLELLTPYNFRNRVLQVRDSGDVVFIANRTVAPGCTGVMTGVYELNSTSTPLTSIYETCNTGTVGEEKAHVELAMSANGTVAFSSIVDGSGAIWSKPVTGPVSQVFLGSGAFYNTLELDVNDAGHVAVNTEYLDGEVGGLIRGVPIFTMPGVAKVDLDFSMEKMNEGTSAPLAINSNGQVALSLSTQVSYLNGSSIVKHTIEPGIYISTPQPFNSSLNAPPSNLIQIANTNGEYCGFGNVDIRDDGQVVFEAKLDGGLGCSGNGFDGIFIGPDPLTDVVVKFENPALGYHQYFDSIRLGMMNNNDSISVLTTYSEPYVDPVKVWRIDLDGLTRSGDAESGQSGGFFKKLWEFLLNIISSLLSWFASIFE